jgi:ribosomal protein L7/L12
MMELVRRATDADLQDILNVIDFTIEETERQRSKYDAGVKAAMADRLAQFVEDRVSVVVEQHMRSIEKKSKERTKEEATKGISDPALRHKAEINFDAGIKPPNPKVPENKESLDPVEEQFCYDQKPIQAIKHMRERTGMGLVECKKVVDEFRQYNCLMAPEKDIIPCGCPDCERSRRNT